MLFCQQTLSGKQLHNTEGRKQLLKLVFVYFCETRLKYIHVVNKNISMYVLLNHVVKPNAYVHTYLQAYYDTK